MKYMEFNINKKLFGEKYLIYDWCEAEDSTHIYVKSQSRTGICPLCGQATLKHQQMDGLNTVLPYGVRKIDALRTLTTETHFK